MVWYGKALIRNAVAQAGLVDTKNADKKQVAGGVDIEGKKSIWRVTFLTKLMWTFSNYFSWSLRCSLIL